jgi:hypothetical protein
VAAGNPALELGLATTNVGNSHDLLIRTSNNVLHAITFGAEVDTLGEVLGAINTQTGGAVTGSFSDSNTRILLTDNLRQTAAVFRVDNAVGSTAAFDLAIFGPDTVEPEPEDDPRDFQIEGGLLGGIAPLDRLFLQNTQAKASLAISTPGGLEADARFGFVGIHGSGSITGLDGTGALTGSVQVGLKPAAASGFDPNAKITIGDLVENIGSIGSFLAGPTIDGSGKLDLGVTITPSFSEIQTGSQPKLTIELTSLAEILDGEADGNKGYSITTQNFDQLLNFDDVGFDDIIAALRALVDFLQQFEEFEFLNEPIPVLNVSFNDLLTFAEDFEQALAEVERNPAATVQVLEAKLKEALGIPQTSASTSTSSPRSPSRCRSTSRCRSPPMSSTSRGAPTSRRRARSTSSSRSASTSTTSRTSGCSRTPASRPTSPRRRTTSRSPPRSAASARASSTAKR